MQSRRVAMVASQSGAIWGDGQAVPGSTALNQDEAAIPDAVSCASPGNCPAVGACTAVGYDAGYVEGAGGADVFVTRQNR